MRPARAFGPLAALAALAGLAAPASVAAASVYLPDGREDVSALRLRPLHGWMEVGLRARDEEAGGAELRESLVSPGLHLFTGGSIYHPRFLEFDLAGTLSLERYRVRGDEDRDDTLGFGDWDASGRVLDHRAVHGTLFSRRRDAWIDSPYRGAYRSFATTSGAEIATRGPVPLGLAFTRERRREDWLGPDRREDRDRVRATASHRVDRSATDLTVQWVDASQNLQPLDWETSSADLRHTLRPSAASSNALRSSLRWFHQTGDLRRRDLGLTEELRVTPTRTLDGTARWGFTEQTGSDGPTVERQLVRAHRGDLGARHRLWGSLTTTLDVYGSRRRVYDRVSGDREVIGTDDRLGARGDLAYARATPWGRLHLGFGLDRAREDQTSQDRVRTVSNEEIVLEDGREPQLANPRVDPTTVIVTDETGFTVYVEGLDYEIVPFGDRFVVRRLPGGTIPDGTLVLVDYAFTVSPALELDRTATSFRFRFDSSRRVSVWYRWGRNREDFVSGIANGFLEDQTRHAAGVRWRWRGVSAGAETERNELTANEFTTHRATLGWDGRLGRTGSAGVGASHARTRTDPQDRTLGITTVNARIAAAPRPGLGVEAQAWARVDRGDPDPDRLDAELWGARVEATRRWRALVSSLGATWRAEDRNGVDDRRLGVHLTVRREF